MSLSYFTDRGYSIVFNRPYNYKSVSEDILSIRSGCSASSSLCVGCYNIADANNLVSMACGNCLSITKTTPRNSPNLYNRMYWYFTHRYSFGFSDVSVIDQNSADFLQPSNSKKVSWDMDTDSGGYRCGHILGLGDDKVYYKIILKV